MKVSQHEVYIVELKGREDLDDIEKIQRLRQWCDDVNAAQKKVTYRMLYLKQDTWDGLSTLPKNFAEATKLGS